MSTLVATSIGTDLRIGADVAAATPITNPAERAWDEYLLRLGGTQGRYSTTQIDAVRTVWGRFRELQPSLAPPHTAPTPDGSLSMVWDTGPHHLEVDVDRRPKVSWFYTNRDTGEYVGREGHRAANLAPSLEAVVKVLS
jgi:hypothetical protein